MKIKKEKFFDLADLNYIGADDENGNFMALKFCGRSTVIRVDFLTCEISMYKNGVHFKPCSYIDIYNFKELKRLYKKGLID